MLCLGIFSLRSIGLAAPPLFFSRGVLMARGVFSLAPAISVPELACEAQACSCAVDLDDVESQLRAGRAEPEGGDLVLPEVLGHWLCDCAFCSSAEVFPLAHGQCRCECVDRVFRHDSAVAYPAGRGEPRYAERDLVIA